jgi:hypothetical protein
MKELYNKGMDSLRKKDSNRNPGNKNSLSQLKNTVESHSCRLKQVEDRFTGLKDKIDTLKNKQKQIE